MTKPADWLMAARSDGHVPACQARLVGELTDRLQEHVPQCALNSLAGATVISIVSVCVAGRLDPEEVLDAFCGSVRRMVHGSRLLTLTPEEIHALVALEALDPGGKPS